MVRWDNSLQHHDESVMMFHTNYVCDNRRSKQQRDTKPKCQMSAGLVGMFRSLSQLVYGVMNESIPLFRC